MKYAVSFIHKGIESRTVEFFDSLQLAINYIKSYLDPSETAVLYEVTSRLTCKYLDNKLLIS